MIVGQTFREDSLTSRPPIAPFNENRLGWDNKKALGDSKGVGIIMSDGDYWRDQERSEQIPFLTRLNRSNYRMNDR